MFDGHLKRISTRRIFKSIWNSKSVMNKDVSDDSALTTYMENEMNLWYLTRKGRKSLRLTRTPK